MICAPRTLARRAAFLHREPLEQVPAASSPTHRESRISVIRRIEIAIVKSGSENLKPVYVGGRRVAKDPGVSSWLAPHKLPA